MIVAQQIKVLPAGCRFRIYDNHKFELAGSISQYDKSILWDSTNDAMRYDKVYSAFHVTLIDVVHDVAGDLNFIIYVR